MSWFPSATPGELALRRRLLGPGFWFGHEHAGRLDRARGPISPSAYNGGSSFRAGV